MNKITIQELFDLAKEKLNELQLRDGYIDFYHHRAFQPIYNFYRKKSELLHRSELIDELTSHFQELFYFGSISQKTYVGI